MKVWLICGLIGVGVAGLADISVTRSEHHAGELIAETYDFYLYAVILGVIGALVGAVAQFVMREETDPPPDP